MLLPRLRTPPGDFEEVYGAEEGDGSEHEPQSGQWDAVLTCFFIDTVTIILPHTGNNRCFLTITSTKAKNVINYLRIIHKILAPGGVWINLGALSTGPRFLLPPSFCLICLIC
jgi:carnosine N-methyltransferase